MANQPLSPENIARLKALQTRFAEHSVTRGSAPNDGDRMDRATAGLEQFRQWCLSQSEYGEEVILRRCPVCGAEEYLDTSGRLKLDHHFPQHNPITVPAHDGEAMPVRRSYTDRDTDDDDDDRIFGTRRRAAGYGT